MKTRMLLILATLLGALPATATSPEFRDEDVLGLEVSGQLLAPAELVAQIGADLAVIRAAFPQVAEIHVFPNWLPGSIGVKLNDDAWAEYQAGLYTGLDDLNAQYGPVTIRPINLIHYLSLDFEQLYHSILLADIYGGAEGVLYASPAVVGGDGDDISCPLPGRYVFKLGWGDCLSGCLHEHFWEFAVSGSVASLTAEYGDAVGGVGDFPPGNTALLEQNFPNPFNPVTVIRYHTRERAGVTLAVHDPAGRLVRELENRVAEPGIHETKWDGRDQSGIPVASGVYFYRLVVAGESQTRKMILTR